MSVPLNVDHRENGLAFSSIFWSPDKITASFNYYTNRSIGVHRPAALDGEFRFSSAQAFPLPPGQLSAAPWDGDPRQPKDLGWCTTNILELSDIQNHSNDADLRTIQDAAWTWALTRHTLRLTLDGLLSYDFVVDFPIPVPPLALTGNWNLFQDYR